VATASNEIDDIRRQMAQIRRELHEDVQGVVAGAEAATDWRRYVRLYPWACVGAAFGLGFLIAPRRRRHGVDRIEHAVTLVPEKVREAVQGVVAETPTVRKKEEKAGLLGMLVGAVGPMVMRAARNYAMSFAENWIAQQTAAGNSPLAFLQNIPGLAGMPGMPGAPEAPTPPGAGVPPGSHGATTRPSPQGPQGPTTRPTTPGL